MYCETSDGTEATETFAHVIYEDQDGEDIPFQQLLMESTFLEDPCRTSKLRQALEEKTGKPPRRAGRRRRKASREQENARTQSPCPQESHAGAHRATPAKAGALHYWNWTREGLFPRQTDSQLRDQQRQPERADGSRSSGAGGRGVRGRAGPGLPSGTVRDDG
jgi:hypothetical protein